MTEDDVGAFPEGGIYKGETVGGQRHGRGKHTYPSGGTYEGEWLNNRRNGHGVYISSDGNRYLGEFRDDMPEGQGIWSFADGGRYEGQWKHGECNGEGMLTTPDGSKYVGSFVDGEFHEGTGEVTLPDGRCYRGGLSADGPHGQGVMVYPDGSEYRGGFVYGTIEGNGSLVKADGAKYEGEFDDGSFYRGTGDITLPDGSRYTGELHGDTPQGRGVLVHPKGREYRGEFDDGKYDGDGFLQEPNGSIFKGTFSSGEFCSGHISVVTPDGTRYEGRMQNGEYDGEGKVTRSDGETLGVVYRSGELVREWQLAGPTSTPVVTLRSAHHIVKSDGLYVPLRVITDGWKFTTEWLEDNYGRRYGTKDRIRARLQSVDASGVIREYICGSVVQLAAIQRHINRFIEMVNEGVLEAASSLEEKLKLMNRLESLPSQILESNETELDRLHAHNCMSAPAALVEIIDYISSQRRAARETLDSLRNHLAMSIGSDEEAERERLFQEHEESRLRHLRKQIAIEKKHSRVREGIVYVLSNELMPGIVKIGFTAGNPDRRALQLSEEHSLPSPFAVEGYHRTADPYIVEQRVHADLQALRVKGEFFRVGPEEALATIARHII